MTPPTVLSATARASGIIARARTLSSVLTLSAVLCSTASAGGIAILDDLFAGVWSPFRTRWQAEAAVCLWDESGQGSYHVTASGASAGDTFRLTAGTGDSVRYRVFWQRRDIPGQGLREELSPGVLSSRPVPGSLAPLCGGEANARVRVEIDRRDIDRASPGIYADTLTLTLSSL